MKIAPNRAWAHSSAAIDDVRTIRHAFGGTFNDVALAAVAGGYRELLITRGEDADHAVLRSLVPVSVRGDDADGVPGNRVSALFYELGEQRPNGAVQGAHDRVGVNHEAP